MRTSLYYNHAEEREEGRERVGYGSCFNVCMVEGFLSEALHLMLGTISSEQESSPGHALLFVQG